MEMISLIITTIKTTIQILMNSALLKLPRGKSRFQDLEMI